MLKTFVMLFILSFTSFSQGELEQKEVSRPFITDGCTGWIDGTRKYDWSHCCHKHDLQMWAGGSKANRKAADRELKQCIKKNSNGFHSFVMATGVWIGSLSPIKIQSKKWGNAWGNNAGYFELTREEIKQLEDSMYAYQTHYSNEEIMKFIEELKELNSHDKNNQ